MILVIGDFAIFKSSISSLALEEVGNGTNKLQIKIFTKSTQVQNLSFDDRDRAIRVFKGIVKYTSMLFYLSNKPVVL